MADINAWNANFPNDVILNTGVLTHEVSAAQVTVGITRGGNNFVSGEERRTIEGDGIDRHLIIGLTRQAKWNQCRFEGTLIQLPSALTTKFLPGSATVSAGTPAVGTTTPAAAGYVIALGDCLVKPTLTFARGSGGTFAVQFYYGIVAAWPGMNAKDINEGEFQYQILAAVNPAMSGYSTNLAPFKLIETAAA